MTTPALNLVVSNDTTPVAQEAAPAAPATPVAAAPAAQLTINEDMFAVPGQVQSTVPAQPTVQPVAQPAAFTPVAPAVAPAPAPQVDPELAARIAALETRAAQMAAPAPAPAPAPAQTPAVTPQMEELNLTPEERTQFKESLPLVQKVSAHAARTAEASIRRDMDIMRADLQNMQQSVQQEIHNSTQQSYDQALSIAIPDMMQLTSNPNFTQFKNQIIPLTGRTVASELADAHRAADVSRISSIMGTFRSQMQAAPSVSQEVSALEQPSAVQNANVDGSRTVVQQSAGPKMLSWRTYQDYKVKADTGAITPEQFDQVTAIYNQADVEGRIDYNA